MVELKERYAHQKDILLKSLNNENKAIVNEFFTFMERKLKRINNASGLDESAYRTLYLYVMRLKNVNKWFKGKSWKELTKSDIRKVYDDLEDGVILTTAGKPFKERSDYYDKIFKSKPFEIAGKASLAREVIEYSTTVKAEVRFLEKDEFLKLVAHAYKPTHKLLMWLVWDYGENINTILQLKKRDFRRQNNKSTKDEEYLLNFRKEILKRSRTPRGELNNFSETVMLLNTHLGDMGDDDMLFNFEYRQAVKILANAIKHSGAKCSPANDSPTWKDFRSGMACYLLKDGWSRDEVNARLGHKPNSSEIDKYLNFLAIDKTRPKAKQQRAQILELQEELDQHKRHYKVTTSRLEAMEEQMKIQNELIRNYIKGKSNISREDTVLFSTLATVEK